jgi:hypothetical protein
VKIQKTAKSMVISGTPAELRALAAKNPKIAQMVNDAQLPAFLEKVDQMYREDFNMPGGLPDALRMQLTDTIRTSLKNTQTPMNSSPSIPPVSNELDGDLDALRTDDAGEDAMDSAVPLNGDPVGETGLPNLDPTNVPSDGVSQGNDFPEPAPTRKPSGHRDFNDFIPSHLDPNDYTDSLNPPTARKPLETAHASIDRNRKMTKVASNDELMDKLIKFLK